jgi:hypothetical protein
LTEVKGEKEGREGKDRQGKEGGKRRGKKRETREEWRLRQCGDGMKGRVGLNWKKE